MTFEDGQANEFPAFGYHSDPERPDAVMDRGPFERALVVDAPVRALAGQVRECRFIRDPGVELPEGMYWFQGKHSGHFG
ncbi:MAG TPA: hypothetical protein VH478_08950, partial [Trebonia sp.]|nr:hypothetical protein [Trebonia sp.]